MTTESLRSSLAGHETFVRRIARALTRDWNEAEDLVQETWAHALVQEPDPAALKPWLAATVRGLMRNRRRGERRRKERERQSASPESIHSPTELLALRQEVVDAVLRLDEPFRTAVTLAYAEGLSPAQIAARERIAPGTARSRLHRAHALLERDLGTREDRGRRYALLAAPGGLARAAGGVSATSAWAAATVALCAGLLALSIALGTWDSSAPKPIEVSAQASEPGADLATASLSLASVQPEEKSEARREPVQAASGPGEHPFWEAVREARRKATNAVLTPAPEDSRTLEKLALPAPPPELPAASLTVLVRAITTPLGVTAFVSPGAESLGAVDLGRLELAFPTSATGAELLDLYCAGGNGELAWEVRRGALYVGTWESLAQDSIRHVHSIADLLLDPRDYFEEVPPSLSRLPIPQGDLAMLVREHLGFQTEVQGTSIEPKGTGIEIHHTGRAHSIASAYLDELREYWLPLPEDGERAQALRTERYPKDAAVLRAVRAIGGPAALLPKESVSVVDHLREVLHGRGVGAVVSRDAQGAQPSDLRFSVRAGYLYVHDADESAIESPTSTLMMELGPLQDLVGEISRPGAPRTVEADNPLIEEAAAEDKPLKLTSSHLEGFIRSRIAKDSWDLNPKNHLRLTDDGQLFATQSPWVIDEIRQLIQDIK